MAGDVYFAGVRHDRAALEESAARAAAGLAGVGATGGRVALFMRNDVAFLVASEAARQAGAAVLPINWGLKAADVAYILEDSGARIVVAHADLWRGVAEGLPARLRADLIELIAPTPPATAAAYRVSAADAAVPPDARDWTSFVAAHEPIAAPKTANLYPLLYTSGTTGRPKGVQRLSASRPEPVAYDAFFEPGMRTLLAAPFYHSAPNRFLQGTFQAGGALVLPARFAAEAMLRDIAERQITTSFMVPAMFQRLLQLPDATRGAYDVSSLRHVVAASAPFPAELKAAMIEWWGPVIYEYYGATETSALTFASSAEALARPGTVGRAVRTARIEIRDASGGLCPPGAPGEVFGRRSDIPDFTYLNAPEARASASAGDLVTVGDVGYLDEEGYLFLSDRKTDMIVANGVNIYPAQVEAAVLTHDAVVDCAAFGVPDPASGEAVAVIVQTHDGAAFDAEALLRHLRDRLPANMLPKRIEEREDLPRDEAGKIRKRDLRDAYWRDAGRKI